MPTGSDLFTNNILIDLDVSIPLGLARGGPEDVWLSEPQMPRQLFNLTKRYLPRNWTAEHRSLVGKALRLIDEHASPVIWPMGKARFLMLSSVTAIIEGLTTLKARFDEATDAKVDSTAYADMRKKMLADHPAFREALASCFPPPERMRRRFRFTWQVFEVQLPRAARLKAAKLAKLDARQKALAAEAVKAQAAAQAFYARHVQAITAEVKEVCARVAERVADGRVVSEATLDAIGNRLKWFDRMCEVVDGKTQAVAGPSIAALKRLVGTTLAADLKDGGAEAARFGAALKRTIVAVDGMADVAVRQAGRSARFLGD